MAKKKLKKSMFKYIPYVALLCGVICCFMILLNVVKTGDESYLKGTEVVFGSSVTFLGQTVEYKFSFLGLLGFLLPLIGGILVCINSRKNGTIFTLVASILFIGGAVLLFIMPSYIEISSSGWFSAKIETDYSLAIGTILGGAFASIGGIGCLAKLILK